jgi:membrane associated rhomboid family serine protease
MQIYLPDPAFTHADPTRAHFRLALRVTLGFVALLWIILLMNSAMGLDPAPFGIAPRHWIGLIGILTAPLTHAGFDHLLSNSLPLVILGTAMIFLYPRSTITAVPTIYVGSGIAVWLLGRDSVHLGASGLVYGLASYVLVAGLLRRDRRAVAAGLGVALLYGSMIWGVFPIRSGMSWETHLAAAVIGIACAVALRRYDIPPPKRYVWEDEPDEIETVDEGELTNLDEAPAEPHHRVLPTDAPNRLH